MSYCPKCGNKITEEMGFCPKCGAPLKAQPTPPTAAKPTTYRRDEKAEKSEKGEKDEKNEKHEKGQYGFLGPLIGGLVLIFVGLATYLSIQQIINPGLLWAFFLIIIGVLIIVAALIGLTRTGKRYPKT